MGISYRVQTKKIPDPTLVVVTRRGEVISRNGRSEVMDKGPQIFQKWIAATKL